MEHVGEIEKRLCSVADHLRANSNFASNEYFLPVMGLIFLRHAYSRFLRVKEEVVATLPSRGGQTRELTKEDFSQRVSIFLKPEAQFNHLVSIPDGGDRAGAIISAMESIEADYATLDGALPKSEYQELGDDDLGQLLRTFNDPALEKADGDVFGRIYEYFLTQFADQKAHDGGEFFDIDPAQAITILKLLHTEETTDELAASSDPESLSDAAAGQQYSSKRRPSLNFEEMGIPIGAELYSTADDTVVTVCEPKKVLMNGDALSLTAATRTVFGH